MKTIRTLTTVLLVLGMADAAAKADFTIGEATCVDQVINNGTNTQECSFLHDGLKLYFANNLPGGLVQAT